MQGNWPRQGKALQLIDKIYKLDPNEEIERIVDFYLQNKLMPSGESRDAIHLAFASYYKIDYLLTWNCAHLANVNKREHIREVNAILGLWVPIITTPLELLRE